MKECRISSFLTMVDWYNFCREVSSSILEKDCEQIGGPNKIVNQSLERGNKIEEEEWMEFGFLVVLSEMFFSYC